MQYLFTSEQLTQTLLRTIDMYQEYVDKHGVDEEDAKWPAVSEISDGLIGEHELIASGVSLTPSFTPVEDDINPAQLLMRLRSVQATVKELNATSLAADMRTHEIVEQWRAAASANRELRRRLAQLLEIRQEA